MRLLDVWVNCASPTEAESIATAALNARLAACANIGAPIASSFHWQGTVAREAEIPLLLKTRDDLFDHLAELIERLHSYETPGIVGIVANRVNEAYAGWLAEETRPRD